MVVFGGAFAGRPPEKTQSFASSREKLAATLREFEGLLGDEVRAELLEAETERGYRQRVRFSMRGQGATLHYSMFDGSAPAAIASFALASPRINALMPAVLAELRRRDALGGQFLRAVHFHAPRCEKAEPVVTLVYGERIDDEDAWLAESRLARAAIRAAPPYENLHFVGRCRGATLVSDRAAVLERLRLDDVEDDVVLEFPEGSFSHPSTRANERSVAWLRERLRSRFEEEEKKPPRLLELYCGAGNHTTCVADLCARVVAVEIDKALVSAAERNLARNGVANAEVLAADAQRFSRRRRRRRSRDPQEDDDYDVLLVDPPRCGLDRVTLDVLRNFDDVLYVSCNPAALRKDLAALHDTHAVAACAMLDAFPGTPHLECLVHLRRRRDAVPSSS